MRYIIIGTGAVGGMLAAYLTHAGHEALVIARPRQADVINSTGIHLTSPSANFVARIKAATGPDKVNFKPDDVVFLSVKSQDSEAALTELKKYVNDVPLFCFQNGVSNEPAASRFFTHVYGVDVMVVAVSMKDAEVFDRADRPGMLIMGRYPNGVDATVEQAAKALRDGGFMCFVTPDVMPYKWQKLILNLGNATGAITNAQGKEANFITQAARSEAEDILKKAGVRWVTPDEMHKEWPETTTWPKSVAPSEASSSTWQSLGRGGSVESDYLNGEIVRRAEKIGFKAPINKKMVEITEEMAAKHEKPGKYTTAELMKILGIKMPDGA